MKIKFNTAYATTSIGYKKGQTAEFPDHTARALIAAGDAEESIEPISPPIPVTDPEQTPEQKLKSEATTSTVKEEPRSRKQKAAAVV